MSDFHTGEPTKVSRAPSSVINAAELLEVQITERKQAEVLVNSQKQALQLLAEGAPLEEVLEFLIGVVERESSGDMLASIVPLNEAGTHFQRGIGPSLPQAFNAGVEGVAVSSLSGICCHAVARREPVAVSDFNEGTEWQAFAQLVAPYGLRSGWSTPIISSREQMLGTFANYYRHAGDPAPKNRELVEIVIRTAAVAIERKRAEEALRAREERFRMIVNQASTGVVQADATGRMTLVNQRWCEMLGYSEAELLQMTMAEVTDPANLAPTLEAVRRLAEGGPDFVIEKRYRRKDGSLLWACSSVNALRSPAGEYLGLVAVVLDITARKRAEASEAGEKKVLELITIGAPLPEILETLMRETEAQSVDGMLCSILLLDETGQKLLLGAAPSLPEAYNRVIHGIAIGPNVGSCGTAAFERQPVFVSDVAIDPLWVDFKELAATQGLAACCSMPMFSSQGDLFGTAAMYYRQPHSPSAHDRQLIERATQLAAIVIERRQAAEALLQKQQMLNIALAASETGVFRWDPCTGEFLELDQNFRELFGFGPDDPLHYASDVLARIHPDDVPGVAAAVEACRGGADFDIEYRVVLPGGKIRWLYDRARTMPGGKGQPRYVVGAITDTTRRKQTEEVLRESEERYRTLFASAPMAVFVCDRSAVIQYYNQRAVKLWGREPACGVEQHCGSMKLWLPDGTLLPHAQSPMVEVLRTGVPARNVEVFIERPDGSRLPVLVNFAALKNEKGEITGAITSFMDITERKQAEESLREAGERFRFMAESMPQKIFTARPNGEVDYFNRQWTEFTGLSFEQIRDWGWLQFIHPDDV